MIYSDSILVISDYGRYAVSPEVVKKYTTIIINSALPEDLFSQLIFLEKWKVKYKIQQHGNVLGDIQGLKTRNDIRFGGHRVPQKIFLGVIDWFLGDIIPCPPLIFRLKTHYQFSIQSQTYILIYEGCFTEKINSTILYYMTCIQFSFTSIYRGYSSFLLLAYSDVIYK